MRILLGKKILNNMNCIKKEETYTQHIKTQKKYWQKIYQNVNVVISVIDS